jgi:hypothetical protein
MQSFNLNEISLYSPSTREEFIEGYDSKFIGSSSCSELLLQFKTPNITREGYTIYLNSHQHSRLKKNPPKGAFYLSHVLEEISEIQIYQSTIKKSADFLRYYIAISVDALPEDVNFIQYERSKDNGPMAPHYKTSREGNIRKAKKPLSWKKGEYFKGTTLLRKFKEKEIGQKVFFMMLEGSSPSKKPIFKPLNQGEKKFSSDKSIEFAQKSYLDIYTIGEEKTQEYNRISLMRQYD